ncbi:winged helix-turn-helix domain-containing protein [Dokdonella sp.]|uniref:winged helix-turn-helix domain-containing protein n=1 Tax=Dokdonella sp. TaxID=2291710 RepID=UPI0035281CBF
MNEPSTTCEGTRQRFRVGDWHADARTGEIQSGDQVERLEPKTMDLLRLLADHPGKVLSREQILEAVWPHVVVADDALARAMFKLRRALGDDAKAARYVETLPKRGYRLIAPVETLTTAEDESTRQDSPGIAATAEKSAHPNHHVTHSRWRGWGVAIVVLAAAAIAITLALSFGDSAETPDLADSIDSTVVERADDFYYRYSRADNEAAVELYERILTKEPDNVAALRGLANALTQRQIRWPSRPSGGSETFSTLTASLADGHLQEPSATRILERAELLARRAIALAPGDSLSYRALGLVLAAQSKFDDAIDAYRTALRLDADAWGALINLSEALELTGKREQSIQAMIDAHAAMTRRYAEEKQHILPYYTELAVLVGDRLVEVGRRDEGEAWYKRALAHSPLHPGATLALARLLEGDGRIEEARQLCLELNARLGDQPGCSKLPDQADRGTAEPEAGH